MSSSTIRGTKASTATASLSHRLAERGIDRSLLMLVPALIFILALFIYPFSYGIGLTFQPSAAIRQAWGAGNTFNLRLHGCSLGAWAVRDRRY
jgi:putative spermidine/putrescine transport system permease protein